MSEEPLPPAPSPKKGGEEGRPTPGPSLQGGEETAYNSETFPVREGLSPPPFLGEGAGGRGSSRRDLFALTLLWLLYFHPLVLHPAQTLYAPYSDFLAEHLPAKLFLNREWRETGEIPLWNPHHFCGAPFVHDIQVGAFYPPYAVVYLVPESAVGAALSWVIALHVLAAGLFAFWYARAHNLNQVGSFVSALGFMLSAKWMTHLLLAGHTVTAGLAWLPLVLLLVERASANRSARTTLGAGLALALVVLGTHPQWALYAGLFALAWTFPTEKGARLAWIRVWAGAVVVAVLLSAVQLLPTFEAGQWSARRGEVEASGSLVVGLQTALALLGPSLSYSVPGSWEMRGVFGVYWLAAAVAAPVVAGGRARWQFGVFVGLVLFAIGGAALVDWLPVLNLFRVPARMLLITAFPLAFLAGVTTHALTQSAWSLEARSAVARGFRKVAFVVGMPTILGLWLAGGDVWWAFIAHWAAVVAALPLFIRVLQNQASGARGRTALWLAVLLADLIAPIAILPAVKPQAELYPSSPVFEYLKARREPVRVLDWDTGDESGRGSPLGIGAPQSLVHGIGNPRGYNPLDVRHYREFLAFVVNDPGPIKGNGPYTQQTMPNFEVGNPPLFAQLSVTHRFVPKGAPDFPGEWRDVLTEPAPKCPPPHGPHTPAHLAPHTLSAATNPLPRARILPRAEQLVGEPLAALKSADLERTVLITGELPASHSVGAALGKAHIREYRPNRVAVELDGTPGWLVLSDVWFPGWTCHVDGSELPVYRANHAFRAVPVPAGAKVAEFRFEPRSYRIGWWVSAVALVLVALAVGYTFTRAPNRSRSAFAPAGPMPLS